MITLGHIDEPGRLNDKLSGCNPAGLVFGSADGNRR
jgi:hypothetical protein